jgi:hypothetical protein
MYFTGATPFFASQFDQRFAYCLYVPEDHEQSAAPLPIVAIVHGTPRTAMACRDRYADFAEEQRCIVVAPLFPAGIGKPWDLGGYKYLEHEGVRYDRVLLEIVSEVGAAFNADAERFYLHGFSGGGQFAHRFLYVHPGALRALSIGAPGRVTLLDRDQPWRTGIADLEERFGVELDLDAIRRVPVHMVVGDQDLDTAEINDPLNPDWSPSNEGTTSTRIDRLRALCDVFRAEGVSVEFDLVPGAGHDDRQITAAVQQFFGRLLRGFRDAA